MTEPQSGAELLARIKPQPKRVRFQICLRPDLLDEHEKAEAELQAARDEDERSPRLASKASGDTIALAKRVQAIEAEIESTSPWFIMEQIPADEFSVLAETNPPRKGDQIDAMLGYDRIKVLGEAAKRGMVDPTFDDDSWAELRKVLNISEWRAILEAADEANGSTKSLPKSRLAATVLTRPANASERQPASASRRGASTGGSRKSSTSTSTRKAT